MSDNPNEPDEDRRPLTDLPRDDLLEIYAAIDRVALQTLKLEDPSFVADRADLDDLVVHFHAAGDQPRYSACRIVAEWLDYASAVDKD